MKRSRKTQISAPPLSDAEVIQRAEGLIDDFLRIVGPDHIRRFGLRFEDVFRELIRPRYGIELVEGIELGLAEDGLDILGNYNVETNTALLSPLLSPESGDARRAFTLWHEVGGHGVLQGQWLREQMRTCIAVTDDSLSPGTRSRLERQANLFAAHAAAPGWLVRQAVRALIPGRDVFPFYSANDYCLVVNGLPIRRHVVDFKHFCAWFAHQIAGWFGGLSDEALGYRLKDLGILVDRSRGGLSLFRTGRNGNRMSFQWVKGLSLDRTGKRSTVHNPPSTANSPKCT